MGKKKARRSTTHTPLSKHGKVGSVLTSPLTGLNVKPAIWDRDWLPEYLWIASLRELAPHNRIFRLLYPFIDAVAEFWPDERLPLGLLSDFGELAPHRNAFLAKHTALVHDLFLKPFGRILSFFPDSPASWLLTEEFLSEGGCSSSAPLGVCEGMSNRQLSG
jgi:hypothetical protein